MTARRGSLRFKVRRLARAPLLRTGSLVWQRRLIAWTRFLSRVVVAAAVLAVVGAFGAQMWRITAENLRLHKQVVAVERRNDQLDANAGTLRREITLLHDPDYLVPLIHEQLGLVKPHEVFIVISATPAPGK